MGLAVFDGQVYPVWAGNFNDSFLNNGTGHRQALEHLLSAAWSSPRAADHQQLDGADHLGRCDGLRGHAYLRHLRPAGGTPPRSGPATPTGPLYHDTNNGDASIPLKVTSFAPTGGGTGPVTQFTATFDPTTANGAASGITNFTGTFSY